MGRRVLSRSPRAPASQLPACARPSQESSGVAWLRAEEETAVGGCLEHLEVLCWSLLLTGQAAAPGWEMGRLKELEDAEPPGPPFRKRSRGDVNMF